MRISRSALVLGFLVSTVGVFSSESPSAKVQAPPILPEQFAGWQRQGAAQTSHEASSADAANAGVLKEYGFTDFASSTYTREDGRTLKIRAARFADASGAVGAYLYYLQPDMQKEQIGDRGVSLNQRVLFYRGNVLVDAVFSRESPMSGAELRELSGALPRPIGNAASTPQILRRMPERGFVPNTERYAVGPIALNRIASPLSAELVDFAADTEVALARYTGSSGEVTLMLIEYPTPQLAADHLRRIDASHQGAQPGITSIENAGKFFVKRTGPIVAIAAGAASDSEARSLLGLVNYEVNVTWNEKNNTDVRDLYNLVLNVVILCAIVGGFAVVAGLAFGGFRILVKRLFPDKVFDRPEQMEFISLHLTEALVQGGGKAPRDSDKTPPIAG